MCNLRMTSRPAYSSRDGARHRSSCISCDDARTADAAHGAIDFNWECLIPGDNSPGLTASRRLVHRAMAEPATARFRRTRRRTGRKPFRLARSMLVVQAVATMGVEPAGEARFEDAPTAPRHRPHGSAQHQHYSRAQKIRNYRFPHGNLLAAPPHRDGFILGDRTFTDKACLLPALAWTLARRVPGRAMVRAVLRSSYSRGNRHALAARGNRRREPLCRADHDAMRARGRHAQT